MKIIRIGDHVVSSRHQHRGRVTQIEKLDLEDRGTQDWLSGLSIPVTKPQKIGEWISILVDGGGAVSVPASSVKVLTKARYEKAYGEYTSPYSDKYFG
jgi:hypothetical protein